MSIILFYWLYGGFFALFMVLFGCSGQNNLHKYIIRFVAAGSLNMCLRLNMCLMSGGIFSLKLSRYLGIN